jgi:hypothetical protein
MTPQPTPHEDDPRIQAAIAELQDLIRSHYPSATFSVGPGEDEPDLVHLTAVVDVEDPDEVVDLVIERMLELQLDEGIPVYVIPIRTPERVAALLEERRAQEQRSASARVLRPATG